jgi:hypothetical protein
MEGPRSFSGLTRESRLRNRARARGMRSQVPPETLSQERQAVLPAAGALRSVAVQPDEQWLRDRAPERERFAVMAYAAERRTRAGAFDRRCRG